MEEDPMAMKFDEVVRKAMKNKKFRADLKRNPTKALKGVGVTATPKLHSAIKKLNWNALNKVNQHYKSAAGIST
jgi:hypothetical protein